MFGQDETASMARIVTLGDEDEVKRVLAATVLDLWWKVVNNLTRLRPSKRERYRVAILGSAHARPETFVYNEAKRLAEAFAGMRCDIVTGGRPGLIQAAHEGARDAGASGSTSFAAGPQPLQQAWARISLARSGAAWHATAAPKQVQRARYPSERRRPHEDIRCTTLY
jgi:SLOG cluster4 family